MCSRRYSACRRHSTGSPMLHCFSASPGDCAGDQATSDKARLVTASFRSGSAGFATTGGLIGGSSVAGSGVGSSGIAGTLGRASRAFVVREPAPRGLGDIVVRSRVVDVVATSSRELRAKLSLILGDVARLGAESRSAAVAPSVAPTTVAVTSKRDLLRMRFARTSWHS